MSKQTTDIYDYFAAFARAAKQCEHWANMIEFIDAKQPIFRLPMLIDKDSDVIFCADFVVSEINDTFCLTEISVSTEYTKISAGMDPFAFNFETLIDDVNRWMNLAHHLYINANEVTA